MRTSQIAIFLDSTSTTFIGLPDDIKIVTNNKVHDDDEVWKMASGKVRWQWSSQLICSFGEAVFLVSILIRQRLKKIFKKWANTFAFLWKALPNTSQIPFFQILSFSKNMCVGIPFGLLKEVRVDAVHFHMILMIILVHQWFLSNYFLDVQINIHHPSKLQLDHHLERKIRRQAARLRGERPAQ